MILKYDPDFTNRELLARSPLPISLDYDLNTDVLYWSDLNNRQVNTIAPEVLQPKLIIDKQGSWMPNSIALDPFDHKLYVLDSFSGTVHLWDIVRNNHAIVIGLNVVEIVKIDIDAYEGYLFLLDKYTIFRTDLDGENRRDIYRELSSNSNDDIQQSYGIPISVTDFTLDVEGKRVYWVSSQTRRIESLDYQGQNRQIHYRRDSEQVGFQTQASLTFLNNKLYWADNLNKNTIVIDLNQDTSQEFRKNLMAIKGISCKNKLQPRKSPCARNNGGCEQVCISSKNSYQYRCTCNIGYKISVNNKSCVPVEDMLLFTLSSYLRGVIMNAKENTFIDAINPSNFQVGAGSTLDLDAKNREIYYSSVFPKDQLHKIKLDSKEDIIMLPDLLSKNVGKFTYDWITKNLYYFTYYYADMTTLSVLNTASFSYSKILIDNVTDLVRDIVIHPSKGYLFFSQTTDNGDIISRMALDGSSLTVIITLQMSNCIDGLAIDYSDDRVYWIDNCGSMDPLGYVQIRHSNLYGEDIQDIIVPKRLERLTDLVVHNNMVFITTGSNIDVIHLNRNRPIHKIDRLEIGPVDSLSSIKIFGRDFQKIDNNNPCATGHSCQKFCLTSPNHNNTLRLHGRCACPYGEKLGNDRKSCIDNRIEEPPFLPCSSVSYKCQKKTKNPL
ncbi:PREDICTED: low-density lipoprotein receptor-related protein 2-like [Ceratosolen solmsi marchali]|uniref:Low-density lipoprotein receptor-related protein 2-like n=1 Tax=Ceratosolen solmsi marchali TaxID=326594 RepID=A0AAJ7DWW2_9HYME|nr:PREDICTED: low-density lipoprotein receptor-related protein 2-like [Ceratosolen solmsi marchali]